MTEPLLKVENLRVGFNDHWILNGLEFEIYPEESVALVGPSGCGKSLMAKALCGLLPETASWDGQILWQGKRLNGAGGTGWNDFRGGELNLMLQEPATGLNPVLTVGRQISESWNQHHPGQKSQSRAATIKLLNEVCIAGPENISRKYPHQLSGGMRQRVLLAAALACEPRLLIADEPTTALDPTVQKEILNLLMAIRRRRKMAMLFISHDPHLVAFLSDRSCTMRQGRVYPAGAEDSVVGAETISPLSADELSRIKPILQGRDLVVEFGSRGWNPLNKKEPQVVHAVAGVDLDLRPGMIVGLAGESGCGKTTLARALVRQIPLSSGTLLLDGVDFLAAKGKALRLGRRKGQLVFQDPGASLNPRQKVGDMLREAADDQDISVDDFLAEVDLEPGISRRLPHQLSGGQRQRVALARALAARPLFLIADEVTSALDPEACETIMSLLVRIIKRRSLAVLQISHDLALLHRWSHQVQVMLGGIILEVYPAGEAVRVRHPYTCNLHLSMPVALRAHEHSPQEREKTAVKVMSPDHRGCPWAHSCKDAISTCYKVLPPLVQVAEGHLSRCPVVEASMSSTFIDT